MLNLTAMEGFGDHVTEFMAKAIEKEHAYLKAARMKASCIV